MSDVEKRECEQKFVTTLREMLRSDKPMNPKEIASHFADDDYLGTEMRDMLLASTKDAA